MRSVRFTAYALACAALLACGGGGGGSSVVAPQPVPTTAATVSGQTAQVSFRIVVSGASTSGAARKPSFVSPATQSVTVALQGAAAPLATINLSGANCTTTSGGTSCTLTVAAPVGSDTFVITCYSGPNAGGNQLSTVTVVATVAANAQNTLSFTLNGVVASAAVILGSTSVLVGTPATITVSVVAYDAAGNPIVGPGNYSSPITLADSDTTGATALSTTSVGGPGTAVTLSYTGGTLAGATITPSVGGSAGTAQTFAPTGIALATYSLTGVSPALNAIVTGGDGNTWISDDAGLVASVTNGGVVNVFNPGTLNSIYGLAKGSDGAMYFGDFSGNLGSITSGGTITFVNSVNVVTGCGTGVGVAAVARRSAYARRSPKGLNALACSGINWMAGGPDGYVWYVDELGNVGSIQPGSGVANSWDITQIPGWTGVNGSAPLQFVFGSDGAMYVGDEGGYIDRITIANGTPTGVTLVPSTTGCGGLYSGPGPLGIAPDGNVWFSDACNNLGVVPIANFTTTAEQSWSLDPIIGTTNVYMMASSPGGVWFTTNQYTATNNNVYRISNLSAASPAPIVSTVTPNISGMSAYGTIGVGANGNVWAGDWCPVPAAATKILYGAPAIGSQSTLRTHATGHNRRNAGNRRGMRAQVAGCAGGLPSPMPSSAP